MQNRMTSRPRQGNTIPEQGESGTRAKAPRLPHERDESADNQPSGEPSGRSVGRAAHHDASRGAMDTSKAPELGRAYGKLKK